jgi:hypothetical protein
MKAAEIELALKRPGIHQATELIVHKEGIMVNTCIIVAVDANLDMAGCFSQTRRDLSSWD